MPAGYSGRTGAAKLGIKNGMHVGLWNAPPSWKLEGLPAEAAVRYDLRGKRDVTVAFIRSRSGLERAAPRLDRAVDDDASLWIAWPRRAGGHESDVTENALRDVLLPLGLVDVEGRSNR